MIHVEDSDKLTKTNTDHSDDHIFGHIIIRNAEHSPADNYYYYCELL